MSRRLSTLLDVLRSSGRRVLAKPGRRLKKRLEKKVKVWQKSAELHLPPVATLCANLFIGFDRYRLHEVQRERFKASAELDGPFWLRASNLDLTMIGRGRNPSNVITFRGPEKKLSKLADHPTFGFVDEIVREKRPYKETTLFTGLLAGRRMTRQYSVNGKKHWRLIETESDFVQYYEHCLALAESIKVNGLHAINSKDGARFTKSHGDDDEIRVGIDANGKFLHCRFGRHRLAIAKTIGIEFVPVAIDFLSAQHLLNFIQRWEIFVPGRLIHAVHELIDDALVQANGPASPIFEWGAKHRKKPLATLAD